jgi:filamentous hemagglutinin family protein
MKCVSLRIFQIWSKFNIKATTQILFKQTNTTAINLNFLKTLGSKKKSKILIIILKTILF